MRTVGSAQHFLFVLQSLMTWFKVFEQLGFSRIVTLQAAGHKDTEGPCNAVALYTCQICLSESGVVRIPLAFCSSGARITGCCCIEKAVQSQLRNVVPWDLASFVSTFFVDRC